MQALDPALWCFVSLGVGLAGVPGSAPRPLPLPAVSTFKMPEDFEERIKRQRIGPTTQLLTQTDFPLQAYEPKVQVPYRVLPGQCPRKLEIERYVSRWDVGRAWLLQGHVGPDQGWG